MAWGTLFLLGFYHGLNPGMGWLFAVALGMQERSGRAVARCLAPLALGHGLAIGAALLAAGVLQVFIPLWWVRVFVACVLIGFGVYRLVRQRHPRWVGMRVGFRDLTLWSFLMASAHGAGLMVLPVVMGHAHGPISGWAVAVHTLGYLLVTGSVAWVVYEKLGLALLKKAWVNLDLVWAVALVGTGAVALVV